MAEPTILPVIRIERCPDEPPLLHHQNEARLLADRLRWLNEQRVISLSQAQEICGKLGVIIYFLDQLAEAYARSPQGSRDE